MNNVIRGSNVFSSVVLIGDTVNTKRWEADQFGIYTSRSRSWTREYQEQNPDSCREEDLNQGPTGHKPLGHVASQHLSEQTRENLYFHIKNAEFVIDQVL